MGNALRQGVRQKMRASPGCFGITVKDCIQRWLMSVQCSLSKLGLLLNQSKPIHELGYGIRIPGARSDRCLRRHGVGNLDALKPTKPEGAHKAFKAYEPGYLHMDVKRLPQMADETKPRYLFVAIDRATRWVFVAIKAGKTAASAKAFLNALHKACAIKIVKLLTDNGKEFTDRLFASRERGLNGNHEFDQLCKALGIEHRLTKPRSPQTNGMVERFNGRVSDVLKTHRFVSGQDMQETLMRYTALYNHQFPQSALKSKTPIQAMKDWYKTHPHLFHKKPL